MAGIKALFVVCMTAVIGWLGGWDVGLKVLLILIAADYLTGVLAGIYLKQLSSDIGLKGICKKIMIIVLVGVAFWADTWTGNTGYVRSAFIVYFVSNEFISIIENAAKMGITVPDVLRKQVEDNAK